MRKIWIFLVPLFLMGVFGWALAGGRARITSVQAPQEVVAGQKFEVKFVVKPEVGRRDVEPVLKASLDDTEIVVVPVRAGSGYSARLALPKAGKWQIRVDSHYCETVMTPVSILARTQS